MSDHPHIRITVSKNIRLVQRGGIRLELGSVLNMGMLLEKKSYR